MNAATLTSFKRRADRRREASAEDAKRLAVLLDDAFRIPGTNIGFGWDTVIGLVPGFGDAATTIVGLAPVLTAWRLGASRGLLARMVGNLAVDAVIGSIPVIGDVFDIFFRANRRNARLLERHQAAVTRKATQSEG